MKHTLPELLRIEAVEWAAVFAAMESGHELAERFASLIEDTMCCCRDPKAVVPRTSSPRTIDELVEQEAIEWDICLSVVMGGRELAARFAEQIRAGMGPLSAAMGQDSSVEVSDEWTDALKQPVRRGSAPDWNSRTDRLRRLT